MSMIALYIDPGTGSMLFSILIGALTTLYFVGRAAILKFKFLFSAKKDGVDKVDSNYKEYVIYCEGNQYWNVFKPVCDEFEKRKIVLNYLTSSKTDPVFDENYEYVKPEFIGEGNTAFARLNMLTAGFVLMTTPGLDVYQLKRSKNVKHYSHVLHMASDATFYRRFGLDYFDSVLLSGDYQKKDIQYLEDKRGIEKKELVTVGCPYLDVLYEKIKNIPEDDKHKFTVLVSPSWGKAAILSKFGSSLLDPLVATGWNIIVRPHPQSRKSETDILEALQRKYENAPNLVWDFERDNIYSLRKADVMISDFSGIIFDYSFLCDKPVLYTNAEMDLRIYDAYCLEDNGKHIWNFEILEKMGIKLSEEQFGDIKNVIENLSDNSELAAARRQARDEAWMHMHESGTQIVDYMISKIGNK